MSVALSEWVSEWVSGRVSGRMPGPVSEAVVSVCGRVEDDGRPVSQGGPQ